MLRHIFQLQYRRVDPWRYADRPEQHRHEAIVAACRQTPARHALEVGCGEGALTRRLARTGAVRWITGIDISGRAVARALEHARDEPASFVVGDVRTAALPQALDLVICADVLYYLAADAHVLTARLARILDPGGDLLLCHPQSRARALHRAAHDHGDLQHISDVVVAAPHSATYVISRFRRRSRG
ncbi:hypothetical protein BH18ACT2_BH18ACT2_16220 [soil metagenome]